MLGMTLETFTFVHVVLSLVGILSGALAVSGMRAGKRRAGWTALFLVTTVATSVSGFGFPFERLLPSHIIGIVSLAVLTVAILARYALHLTGVWRTVYAICAVAALYFNVFVLVVQSFLKIPALHALAPTQTEPPFAIAQLAVLALFVWLGIGAVKGFRSA